MAGGGGQKLGPRRQETGFSVEQALSYSPAVDRQQLSRSQRDSSSSCVYTGNAYKPRVVCTESSQSGRGAGGLGSRIVRGPWRGAL